MTAQARRNVVRWGASLSGGLVAAAFVFIVLVLAAALARAQELVPPLPAPPETSGWLAWLDTPEGRVAAIVISICLFVDAMRKSWPPLRRRKDGSIAWWAAALIWCAIFGLSMLAAYGGLLAPFTAGGRVGVFFAGLLVFGTCIAFNEVVMATLRKALQGALVRLLGANAPNVELTPGPDDVPPSPGS